MDFTHRFTANRSPDFKASLDEGSEDVLQSMEQGELRIYIFEGVAVTETPKWSLEAFDAIEVRQWEKRWTAFASERIGNLAAVKQVRFLLKDDSEIVVHPLIKEGIAAFLSLGKPFFDMDCAEFVCFVMNLVHPSFMRWNAAESNESDLVTGDIVLLFNEEKKLVHFAIYLGKGPQRERCYISKFGTSCMLAVTTLKQLHECYKSNGSVFKAALQPEFWRE